MRRLNLGNTELLGVTQAAAEIGRMDRREPQTDGAELPVYSCCRGR